MRFGIVGAGPVGSILALHLVEAGQEVYLVDTWKEHLEAILKNGIELEGFRQGRQKVTGGFSSIAELGPVKPDYLILSVKACVLRAILKEVETILGPDTVVISLQNGLDTEELIAHGFSGNRIFRVVVNYAGNVTAPGKVAMSFFNKPNHIGCNCRKENCGHADELANILNGVYLDTKPENDIKRYVWEKTILNASLSPVSAVTGFTMREVMDSSETYRIVEMLLKECIMVAARAGYDFGPGFFNYCTAYLDKGGPHKPSMLVDIENKRETEIDFINGRIAFYGSLNNVPTPVNDTFTRLVKAVENTYLHPEKKRSVA
ncbi:MAG: 2-dehydropantoate 2-reductase [Acidobacteria bacterium]|nr:2-dehydropantoate 2-reductase [Acidobacteriota bacterium]